MDKNTLLLIFVLFLLSSQLWSISWNIGVSAFYIIIIISVLNYVNPDSSIAIRSTIIRIINLDSSIFTNILSRISRFILSFFDNSHYRKLNKLLDFIPKPSNNNVILERPKKKIIKEDNSKNKIISEETRRKNIISEETRRKNIISEESKRKKPISEENKRSVVLK